MREIFTIGYGGRTADEFVALLEQYGIDVLADVRSSPYSSYYKDFDKPELSEKLGNIRYKFMGEVLGGKPEGDFYIDPFDKTKGLDLEKCEANANYMEGIDSLIELSREQVVALMCAEKAPQHCHRGRIIGKTLEKKGVTVKHINEVDEVTEQAEIPGYTKIMF